MHLLLPPSETKRSGGGGVFSADALARHELLGGARSRVREALVVLGEDRAAAVKALKLGVRNADEVDHNLRLEESGVLPAIERYTGVLYDALDPTSLPGPAREWLHRHVSVQSALFGLIAAGDPIPAYRLSASTRLPALGAPLKRFWGQAHAGLDWRSLGWVLDLRSKDYVQLAPLPSGAGVFLRVAQRSSTGEIAALNHFNKAAKGDLVRRLALSRASIGGLADLLRWARRSGLELSEGPGDAEVTLITEFGAPTSTGARTSLEAVG